MAIDYGSGIAQFNPLQASGPVVPTLTNTGDLSTFGGSGVNGGGGIMDIIAPGGSGYFPDAPGMQQNNGLLGGLFGGGQQGGGFNWNALGNISNLIGGFGGLYSAFQGAKIAKQSLALQREAYEKNLANQTKSYNTALSDRARSRGVMESSNSGDVDRYIQENSL